MGCKPPPLQERRGGAADAPPRSFPPHLRHTPAARRGSSPDSDAPAAPAAAPGRPLTTAERNAAVLERSAAAAEKMAAWEEGKRLKAKVEGLREKLEAKRKECEEALAAGARAVGQLAAAQRDAARSAALARDLTEKLAAEREAGAAVAAPPPVDASLLKEYVARVLELEGEVDGLRLALEAAQRSLESARRAGAAPPPAAPGSEAYAAQAAAARDAAAAAAARTRAHLLALFGPNAESLVPPPAAPRPGKRGGPPLAGRESELLATVGNLKAALERAMAASTPTSRFLQEVKARKDAQKAAEAARVEAGRLRQQLEAADRAAGELQASAAELRRGGGAAAAGGNAAGLQAALAQRDAEIGALRAHVLSLERQAGGGRGGGAPPVGGAEAAAALGALRQRVAELQAENEDLKTELNAFDPAFFEEIEDLKHAHHVLRQRCAEQERLLAGRA